MTSYNIPMLKLCVICFCIGKPFDMTSAVGVATWNDTYSRFLRNSCKDICPKCENKNCMIQIDTPRAQRIIKENNLEIKEYYRKPLMDQFVWEKDYKIPEK